jgi:hypothetical protein
VRGWVLWHSRVVRRADSDEAYVLDLCDEVLGDRGSRQHRFDWLVGTRGALAGVAGADNDVRPRQDGVGSLRQDLPVIKMALGWL